MAKKQKKEIHRGGCLCCPRSEDFLSLGTVLYYDFGGYTVYRNGKAFYMGRDVPGKRIWTLDRVEKYAKLDPNSKWVVELDLPLRGATWRRNKKGQWVLIETNPGFA